MHNSIWEECQHGNQTGLGPIFRCKIGCVCYFNGTENSESSIILQLAAAFRINNCWLTFGACQRADLQFTHESIRCLSPDTRKKYKRCKKYKLSLTSCHPEAGAAPERGRGGAHPEGRPRPDAAALFRHPLDFQLAFQRLQTGENPRSLRRYNIFFEGQTIFPEKTVWLLNFI